MPVETLQSTEASVMQLFSLSDSDWVALPSLFASEVATLSSTLEFVAGLLTLPREEWGLVLSRSSKSLDLSRESLAKHVQALQTYGFYQKGIRNLLVGSTASYMVVSASAERIIIPAMAALEELLGGGDKQAVIELCPRCPGLAVSRPAKLRHNFHVLLGYGLTEEQARQLLLEVPQLYTWDLGGPEMQAKLRYYQEVFGIGPLQMLLNRRGYLREGLAKVDLRVFCLEKSGKLHHRVQQGSLSWIPFPPARFCKDMDISEVEWKAWEAEWAGSERALRYALVGPMRRGFRVRTRLQ